MVQRSAATGGAPGSDHSRSWDFAREITCRGSTDLVPEQAFLRARAFPLERAQGPAQVPVLLLPGSAGRVPWELQAQERAQGWRPGSSRVPALEA